VDIYYLPVAAPAPARSYFKEYDAENYKPKRAKEYITTAETSGQKKLL